MIVVPRMVIKRSDGGVLYKEEIRVVVLGYFRVNNYGSGDSQGK